jgi:hypothetical protein
MDCLIARNSFFGKLASIGDIHSRLKTLRIRAAESARRVEADQDAAEIERTFAWDEETGIDAIESVVTMDNPGGKENSHVDEVLYCLWPFFTIFQAISGVA